MSSTEASHIHDAEDSQLRFLANALPQIVWISASDGKIIFINDRWREYSGSSDMSGFVDFIHPGDTPRVVEMWRASIASGQTFDAEYRVRRADNTYRWHLTRAVPVRDPQGDILRWYGTSTDITAQKNEQKANLEFRRITETIPQGVWRTDVNGSADYFSEQFAKYVGIKDKSFLGWGWAEAIHPEDQPGALAEWQRCRELRQPVSISFRVKAGDGNYYWYLSMGNPFFNDEGELTHYYGTWTNIDEQVKTSARLRESEQHLKNLVKNLEEFRGAEHDARDEVEHERAKFAALFAEAKTSMALVRGPTHIYENINQSYSDLLAQRDIVGKPLLEALPELKGQPFPALLDEVFKTGVRYVEREAKVFIQKRKDGPIEESYIDQTYTRMLDKNGAPYGVLIHAIDITEKVMARRAIERAKEQAESANQLKSAFLANMSHEIRTPLGAMLGFSDLLRDPTISQQERMGYVEILRRNGEQLSHIINDILDISKVEAGALVLEYVDANPVEVATEVTELLSVQAREKGLRLELIKDEGAPKQIVTDIFRVKQVLLNLIGNAIKFTDKGQVKVRCFGEATGDGKTVAGFEVSDSGIGMTDEQRKVIFATFVQADSSMTRKFGGTGLGLALSRSLARTLGGDVILKESKPGAGSTFIFTILNRDEHVVEKPIPAKPSSQTAVNTSGLNGLKVLLVDDSPDNQQLILRYLKKNGIEVELASNGMEAVEKAIAGQHDLILMDIQMPVMDGYTATQLLRDKDYRKPIIAITAHAMSEARRKCLNVGCSDHLSKPIDYKAMIEMIGHYSGRI